MSVLELLLAAFAWCGVGAASPKPATELLDYGLFGTLHVSRPSGDVSRTVLFFSDRDGWNARQDRLASAHAGEGALVVGIYMPT